MKSHLLLVLQTHSLGDSTKNAPKRFCGANKAEVMRRCTKSLIDSINYAVDLVPNFSFELVILDDHSDDKALTELEINLSFAKFTTSLVHLESHGIMPSILSCYKYGKKHGSDWVYFVQDDYLYEETAIYDMLLVAIDCTKKLGNFASVFPYDDPYRYTPINTVIQSHIIRAQGRHWRTQVMTSSCFMVHHQVIVKNWDLFEAMGNHKVDSIMEDETINQLFRSRGYYLFVPLKSLAYHMQYETELDPFVDWKSLWDKYESPDIPLIDPSKKNLLNVGFGGLCIKDAVYNEDLNIYDEITLDIDSKYSPDIVCDILDMSSIPTDSFDCIYASHVLEHIDYFSAPKVLMQFKRILKPNGFARIVVPNIKVSAMYLLQDKLFSKLYDSSGGPVTPYDLLYSNIHHVRKNGTDWAFHKAGYTIGVVEKLAKDFNLCLDAKEVDTNLLITLYND